MIGPYFLPVYDTNVYRFWAKTNVYAAWTSDRNGVSDCAVTLRLGKACLLFNSTSISRILEVCVRRMASGNRGAR